MTSPSSEAKPGDLPECFAAIECPRKGVQAAGNFSPEERPVASLSLLRGREGDGILSFGSNLECAGRAERRRRFGLSARLISFYPKRRRTSFAAALQILAFIVVALAGFTSCSRFTNHPSPSDQTRVVTDEAGRRVNLPLKIDRVVSLAPNLTEIVYAVGAGDRLVGDTTYCDYPEAAQKVAKVGDTMTPSVERIIALKPQIVLVSTASQLESFTNQLSAQQIAVYVTNPQSLDDVLRSIQTLGDLFNQHDRAVSVVSSLRTRADAVDAVTRAAKPVKVFYQVAGEPLYTIGREAFVTDLVRRAGGLSVTA